MNSKPWVVRFLAAAVLLPVVIVVLAAMSRLLRSMGDVAAAIVLDRLALTGGVLWTLSLLALLLAMAARFAAEPDEE